MKPQRKGLLKWILIFFFSLKADKIYNLPCKVPIYHIHMHICISQGFSTFPACQNIVGTRLFKTGMKKIVVTFYLFKVTF